MHECPCDITQQAYARRTFQEEQVKAACAHPLISSQATCHAACGNCPGRAGSAALCCKAGPGDRRGKGRPTFVSACTRRACWRVSSSKPALGLVRILAATVVSFHCARCTSPKDPSPIGFIKQRSLDLTCTVHTDPSGVDGKNGCGVPGIFRHVRIFGDTSPDSKQIRRCHSNSTKTDRVYQALVLAMCERVRCQHEIKRVALPATAAQNQSAQDAPGAQWQQACHCGCVVQAPAEYGEARAPSALLWPAPHIGQRPNISNSTISTVLMSAAHLRACHRPRTEATTVTTSSAACMAVKDLVNVQTKSL